MCTKDTTSAADMQPDYLQSHDHFDEIMLAGPSEGDLRKVTKRPSGIGHDMRSLIGLYGSAGAHRAYLYRWEGQLKIRIDDDVPIAVVAGVSSSWEMLDGCVRFSLLRDGRETATIHYKPSHWLLGIQDDPTPFLEPEDFDLCLLIHRVLRDASRQDRLFRRSSP